jgi:hypothetical protein
MQNEDGVRAMQEAFQNSKIAPHWPMYLRNVKQFITNSSPTFDEQRYGFHSFLEAVRSGQRAGLFRLERNRQGILRVFPGSQMSQGQRFGEPQLIQPAVKPFDIEDELNAQPVEVEAPSVSEPDEARDESQSEAEPAIEEAASVEVGEAEPEKPVRKRRASFGIKRKTVAPRKATAPAAKRARKKAVPPAEEENAS